MASTPYGEPLSECMEREEIMLREILLDPTAIGRFAQELPSGTFYFDANREIFCAALLLHSQGKPTDLTFMTALLAATDRLEQVGGSGRLVDIVEPDLDDSKD